MPIWQVSGWHWFCELLIMCSQALDIREGWAVSLCSHSNSSANGITYPKPDSGPDTTDTFTNKLTLVITDICADSIANI